MCVIITQPKGTYLSREVAEAAWKRNPDGGGFAYIDQDTEEIVLYKYMNFDKFWGHFERARSKNRDQDFLIHMRIATHGSVCLANVHPFVVNDHTVMAHNGIIQRFSIKDPEGQDRSDTRLFIDYALKDLEPGWLDNKYMRRIVEDEIGWSRLAFLTTHPALEKNLYILNEGKGTTFRGMWFSNDQSLREFMPKPKVSQPINSYGTVHSYPRHSTPPVSKGKAQEAARKADWDRKFEESALASDREKRQAELDELFSDYYMPGWCEDPTADGISEREATKRWMNVTEEIATLIDGRQDWLKMPKKLAEKLAYHPKSQTIYCKHCLERVTMSGICSCFDYACATCEKGLTDCSCSVPMRVDLETGERIGFFGKSTSKQGKEVSVH